MAAFFLIDSPASSIRCDWWIMRLESGYARAFLRVVKNAALAELITIIPMYKVTEESQQAGMIVMQNGTALKWFYTRNNPNGMPELEPCKMKDPQDRETGGRLGQHQANGVPRKYAQYRNTPGTYTGEGGH